MGLNFALTVLTKYDLAVAAHYTEVALAALIYEISHLRKPMATVRFAG
jgi:hypothetical protein